LLSVGRPSEKSGSRGDGAPFSQLPQTDAVHYIILERVCMYVYPWQRRQASLNLTVDGRTGGQAKGRKYGRKNGRGRWGVSVGGDIWMCTVPGEKLGEDGGCAPLKKRYLLLNIYLLIEFIKYFFQEMSHIWTSNLIGNPFLTSYFQWYLIGIFFNNILIN